MCVTSFSYVCEYVSLSCVAAFLSVVCLSSLSSVCGLPLVRVWHLSPSCMLERSLFTVKVRVCFPLVREWSSSRACAALLSCVRGVHLLCVCLNVRFLQSKPYFKTRYTILRISGVSLRKTFQPSRADRCVLTPDINAFVSSVFIHSSPVQLLISGQTVSTRAFCLCEPLHGYW